MTFFLPQIDTWSDEGDGAKPGPGASGNTTITYTINWDGGESTSEQFVIKAKLSKVEMRYSKCSSPGCEWVLQSPETEYTDHDDAHLTMEPPSTTPPDLKEVSFLYKSEQGGYMKTWWYYPVYRVRLGLYYKKTLLGGYTTDYSYCGYFSTEAMKSAYTDDWSLDWPDRARNLSPVNFHCSK